MRIAMVMDSWFPILGGGQNHIINLSHCLIENYGVEIDLFVRSIKLENGEEYDNDEILEGGKLKILRCGKAMPFFNVFGRILSVNSMYRRIVKENESRKYDFIHAHAYLGLLIGKLSSKKLNLPIIATLHGTNLMDKGEKSIYAYLERVLLTKIRYDILISVSSHIFDFENVNKNIVIIGNGINQNEFIPKNKIDKNRFKILFVGRLDWVKGIHVLIDAIGKIEKKLLKEKNVSFDLVGYGYEIDKIKTLINENKLESFIKIKGKKEGNELLEEYRTSNLFVLPSITEGFPLTILEAMGMKIPVLSSSFPGVEDIIINGRNGFLFENKNSEDLKDKLELFIKGKINNIEDVKIDAYNTVINLYTWDIIAKKTYSQYKKLY